MRSAPFNWTNITRKLFLLICWENYTSWCTTNAHGQQLFSFGRHFKNYDTYACWKRHLTVAVRHKFFDSFLDPMAKFLFAPKWKVAVPVWLVPGWGLKPRNSARIVKIDWITPSMLHSIAHDASLIWLVNLISVSVVLSLNSDYHQFISRSWRMQMLFVQ